MTSSARRTIYHNTTTATNITATTITNNNNANNENSRGTKSWITLFEFNVFIVY